MALEKTCGTCKRSFKGDDDIMRFGSQWRVCSSSNLWFNCVCGSTLMVPKGKFAWYSPANVMSAEARTLFNTIGSLQELPHIPSAVLELQQLLTNPETETHNLTKAVKADPFLAAEVLNVASNLRRLRETPADAEKDEQNIEYAITFIGRRQLSGLVAAAAVKRFKLKTTAFHHEAFWEHSLLTAGIAEVLTKEFFPEHQADKDRAYLGGCLCNIGKIVGAIAYPEVTDAVYLQVNNPRSQTTWMHAEECHELVSHTVLGEIGAAFWGFPAYVIETIKYHHEPLARDLYDDPSVERLCHLVCLANMLGHWLNLEPHRIDDDRLDLETRYFNLTRPQLETLVARIQKLVIARK